MATARASGIVKSGSRRPSHIPCAKINDLVSFCRQQLGELPLHLESTVIRSYSYFT